MIEESRNYQKVNAYSGIGSDIKWCGRFSGGKRCLYCRHHAKFNEWSNTWHWHYLLNWYEHERYGRHAWWSYVQSHYKYGGGWYSKYVRHPKTYDESPRRYFTVGLTKNEIKSVLKKPCRKNNKCKCVNIAQRGSWCCPECYYLLARLAKHHGMDIHDIMISNRDDLKQDILILLLSGTL